MERHWRMGHHGKWKLEWRGDTPSLPTGPTMEAIGHVATDVVLEWPDSAVGPCIGPSIDVDSRFSGGDRIRISLAKDEYLWIEKRTQEGYDQSLPGEGVLVLLEDKSAGDSAYNALNIDRVTISQND